MSNLKPINIIYYDKNYLKSEDNINYENNYDIFIEKIFNKFEIKKENKSFIDLYFFTSNNEKILIENSENFNNIEPSKITKIELIYKNNSKNDENNFDIFSNSNYELFDKNSINSLNKNESINFQLKNKNFQIEENNDNISNINYITESENFNELSARNKNYSKKTTINNNDENNENIENNNNSINIENHLNINEENIKNFIENINKILNDKFNDFEKKIENNLKEDILNINNILDKNKNEIKEFIENENLKSLNLIKELTSKSNLFEITENENKFLSNNLENNKKIEKKKIDFNEEYISIKNNYQTLTTEINNINDYLKTLTNNLNIQKLSKNKENYLIKDNNISLNFFSENNLKKNIKNIENEIYSIEYIINDYDMLIEKLLMEQSLINITIKNNGKINWPENCYLCQIKNNNNNDDNDLYFDDTLINFGEKVKPNEIIYIPILIKTKGKIDLKNYFISYEVKDKNFKQLNINNFGYLNLKIYNLEKSNKLNKSLFKKK